MTAALKHGGFIIYIEVLMQFRLGEFFCGPGGIGYAAITAKSRDNAYTITHAWANDYDRDTCNTFIANIAKNPATVICEDIRSLDYKRLKKISAIDALAFGFPCNDFSVVGEQKGMDGVYGPLYSFGIKGLQVFKPLWVLAENVGGLKNANDGRDFSKILREMFDAGYSVYPHLYKFEDYGVPQARHRIIIIGIRKDQDVIFKIPSTNPYKAQKRTCRDALEKPPIPPDAPNNELTKQSADVINRLTHIKAGENAFTADIPEKLQLNISGVKLSQIYRRLDPNKPAYTVTGSGGGGTHVYHWSENRALTNRERARLQTFPDDFFFHGSKESVRRQIGMAVPVEGVRIIFESLLNCFAGIGYEAEPASIHPLIQEKHIDLYNEESRIGQMYMLEKPLEEYGVL
jgi:DNA (cytosine-5)-methyltransferase 1